MRALRQPPSLARCVHWDRRSAAERRGPAARAARRHRTGSARPAAPPARTCTGAAGNGRTSWGQEPLSRRGFTLRQEGSAPILNASRSESSAKSSVRVSSCIYTFHLIVSARCGALTHGQKQKSERAQSGASQKRTEQ